MIEEYRFEFKDAINSLGRTLKSTYDVGHLGEFEKIVVYLKGNEAIGFVQYLKLYECVEICYIVVDSRYRKLGIGSELIDHISRDLDVEKMILEVRSSNETAISFYEKNGFKRVRPIKGYYSDGEDALAMEKVIR